MISRNFGIYQIRNLVTDTRYVGKTERGFAVRKREHHRRLAHGQHCNAHLQRSWNKYGSENFVFEPLAIIEPSLLTIFEQRAFDILSLKRGCYNQGLFVDSPRHGRTHSKETRRKMSAASRAHVTSHETRRKISEAKQNISVETRRKIGEARKRWWAIRNQGTAI